MNYLTKERVTKSQSKLLKLGAGRKCRESKMHTALAVSASKNPTMTASLLQHTAWVLSVTGIVLTSQQITFSVFRATVVLFSGWTDSVTHLDFTGRSSGFPAARSLDVLRIRSCTNCLAPAAIPSFPKNPLRIPFVIFAMRLLFWVNGTKV